MECAKEAQAYEREIAAKEESELVATLKGKGMQVNEIKDLKPFMEACKSLRQTYIQKIGKDAEEMFKAIDALRDK